MAGLAAGIRLAMYDRKVLIIERHNAPGGLNSFYSLEGRKYDVGLHAVTNFVPPTRKGTPLAKLCRQLRIPRESLELREQIGSRIAFPEHNLRFTNDFSVLEAEVAAAFPQEIDRFRALRQAVLDHNEFDYTAPAGSARDMLARHGLSPLLTDMLMCPLCYYGSARQNDMDWDQFVIMWKALFEEGFARPYEGVRVIIRALLQRFREVGGQRKMKCGVRWLHSDGQRVTGVELDDGSVYTADLVISTAGLVETQRLCSDMPPEAGRDNVGALSFCETITVLDCQPRELGWDETIVFFNDSERFHYEAAVDDVDLRSGVICLPSNYRYDAGQELPEGLFRVTALANFQRWAGLDEGDYRARKQYWYAQLQRSALRFMPELPAGTSLPAHTKAVDMFTPRTVKKFTGHLGGAIYGAPQKQKDGRTHLDNLVIAGTDQGFLGIVGAMLSGISMANLHGLK
ncbi:MAG: FAD-binding monooxygenase protein [Puniceicoccaceae bacterium 5H]|nr:MAG: FAD-binding monooxygenase protein [Puniceicoccaceae bacterium 5H]